MGDGKMEDERPVADKSETDDSRGDTGDNVPADPSDKAEADVATERPLDINPDGQKTSSDLSLALVALLASSVVAVVQSGGQYTLIDTYVGAFLLIIIMIYRNDLPSGKWSVAGPASLIGLATAIAVAGLMNVFGFFDTLRNTERADTVVACLALAIAACLVCGNWFRIWRQSKQ